MIKKFEWHQWFVKTIKNNRPNSEKLAYERRLTNISQLYQKFGGIAASRYLYLPSSRYYNLTISHERRFVWFRVAKVCTRSILQILTNNGVTLDAVHPYNCYYPVQAFTDYFCFAFVRNPWDRLVSCWHNKVVKSNYYRFADERYQQMQEFSNFVEYLAQMGIDNTRDPHIRLQSHLIDLNHVDFIGRFETYQADLENVLHQIELDNIVTPHRNRTINRRDYRTYYDDETASKVSAIYAKDIQIFGYSFD